MKKKYLEKDKDSENCKLLRIVEEVIRNFKSWVKEDEVLGGFAENTYLRKFTYILDILLEDADVTVYDCETVSKATQLMQILNEDEDTGRKVALLSKTRYNDFNIELRSIEFEVRNADNCTFKRQQSKNIRTNSCITNNINNITNKSNHILYMDWKGREGYLAHIFRYQDIMISQHVDSLYIPKDLIELDDFRNTLKYLYLWRHNMVKLSNETKLAAYKESRKYIVSDVSSSHKSLFSPPRSPSQKPMITPFFPPTNKRTRDVMEQEE